MFQRLPIHFPNLFLRLMPMNEAAVAAVSRGQMPRELTFRVPPSTSKVEIKRYLQSVYGLNVEKVFTMNYQGKKLRIKPGKNKPVSFFRRADYKKAIVQFGEPAAKAE